MKFLTMLFILACIGQAHAKDVMIKPFKVKLESVEKPLDFSSMTASYTVECWYEGFSIGGSIFDPSAGVHRQRCGESYGGYLKINEQNEIEVPAIEAYSGLRGRNLNNYVIHVYLSKKISKFRDVTYMRLVLSGKKVITDYVNDPKRVLFHTVKFRDIDVTYKNEDFFKSEAARVKGVGLSLRFSKDLYNGKENDPSKKAFISGELQSENWYARDSYLSQNSDIPAPKDLNAIVYTKEMTFPVLEGRSEKQDVELDLSYEIKTSDNSYRFVMKASTAFKVDLTKEALESIQSIDLKENTDLNTNR